MTRWPRRRAGAARLSAVIAGAVIAAIPFSVLPAWTDEIGAGALGDPATWAGAEIVLLGEVHDNPVHHERQAAAIAAISPAALVWEMLPPDAAGAYDPALVDDPAALGERLGWADLGWPDFAMYAPIFAAAPEADQIGAALTPQNLRRSVTDGAAAVIGSGAGPLGLDRPFGAARQAAEEARMDAAHCGMLPEEMLPGMVEAQRARDGALALAALAALDRTGGPVAVILGNGHAEAQAVPELIRTARPGTRLLTLGQFEAPTDAAPFDLWSVAPPVERGDPCDAFR